MQYNVNRSIFTFSTNSSILLIMILLTFFRFLPLLTLVLSCFLAKVNYERFMLLLNIFVANTHKMDVQYFLLFLLLFSTRASWIFNRSLSNLRTVYRWRVMLFACNFSLFFWVTTGSWSCVHLLTFIFSKCCYFSGDCVFSILEFLFIRVFSW